MSLIRDYLAMEDHSEAPDVNVEVEVEVEVPEVQDVSEDEEYAADAEISEQEAVDRERQLEIEQAHVVAQETYARLDNIARHREILEHGIEAQQYSPQFAASVQASLEEYQEIFGGDLEIASLENYGHDNLGEYYHASLEAFGNVTKKLGDVVKAVAAKVARTKQAIGEDRKVADALIKKIDASLNDLNAVSDSKVSVSLAGVKDRLSIDGVIKEDLAAAVKEHTASVNYLFTTFIPSEIKFLEQVASGEIAEAMKATNPMADGKTVKLLGGRVAKDGDAPYAVIDVKANDSEAKDIEITKAGVQKLLTDLKKAVVVYKASVADQGVLGELAKKLDADTADNAVTQDVEAAEDFLKTVREDNDALMELIIDVSLNSRRSLIAVHQFVERAVKKLAKESKKDDK